MLDLNICLVTPTYSVFIPTTTKGFSQFYPVLKRSFFHLKWRGDLLYRLHSSQLNKRAASCQDSDPPWPGLFPLARKSLRTRRALHGLPHGPGARANRFICTQSHRMAASHSNCISAYRGRRGWGEDPVVHITAAETNLAEMEGEMEKAHLLH